MKNNSNNKFRIHREVKNFKESKLRVKQFQRILEELLDKNTVSYEWTKTISHRVFTYNKNKV